MVSFIDCHLSLRRCSPFNGGKFEGWGTSFCWWPNRIGYLDELSEQAAKLFFDPKEGLGLNIIRYNIGGCGRFLGPELSNSKTASILHRTQTT